MAFLKARVALPLFFERALIEITPRRVLYWADGDARRRADRDRPSTRRPRDGATTHRRTHADTRRPDRASTSSRRIPSRSLTWVDDDGYPVSVAVEAADRPDRPDRHVRCAGRAWTSRPTADGVA